MECTIGIDVGGTFTDAVLSTPSGLPPVRVHCSAPTTYPPLGGIVQAIKNLLQLATAIPEFQVSKIKYLIVGTTHFINALVQRDPQLSKVCVIRLCGPSTLSCPPFCTIPQDLASALQGPTFLVSGGFEYNGVAISELDKSEIEKICQVVKNSQDISHVVVSGVFSPIVPSQELEAAEIIAEKLPNCTITISHQISNLGLLERENASILNAAISRLATSMIDSLCQDIRKLGIECPIYLSSNDGSILTLEGAKQFPIQVCNSGPTNSMRGAAFLCKSETGIVLDIGGTTTEFGILENGEPREIISESEICGVKTNFRMSDVLSIGLGGGSVVRVENDTVVSIGPQSVGFNLLKQGLVFGGHVLTATDLVVAKFGLSIGDPSKVAHLSQKLLESGMEYIRKTIEVRVQEMKTSAEEIPLIVVGGGAILVDETWKINGISQVMKPGLSKVANAIGASLGKITARVDTLKPTGKEPTQEFLLKLKETIVQETKQKAVAQ